MIWNGIVSIDLFSVDLFSLPIIRKYFSLFCKHISSCREVHLNATVGKFDLLQLAKFINFEIQKPRIFISESAYFTSQVGFSNLIKIEVCFSSSGIICVQFMKIWHSIFSYCPCMSQAMKRRCMHHFLHYANYL